jgi:hypothetical protein
VSVDPRGGERIVRLVYECGVLQALRDRLRCKEIWVVGADKWRNPDEDLPQDFDEKRDENYAEEAIGPWPAGSTSRTRHRHPKQKPSPPD